MQTKYTASFLAYVQKPTLFFSHDLTAKECQNQMCWWCSFTEQYWGLTAQWPWSQTDRECRWCDSGACGLLLWDQLFYNIWSFSIVSQNWSRVRQWYDANFFVLSIYAFKNLLKCNLQLHFWIEMNFYIIINIHAFMYIELIYYIYLLYSIEWMSFLICLLY